MSRFARSAPVPGKPITRTTVLASLLAALTVVVIAAANAGSAQLDPSFGRGGKVTTDFGAANDDIADGALAIARQPGGKLIAAGYSFSFSHGARFALARYRPDGALDSSFGSHGKVLTAIGDSAASAVALQADGKIVAAGSGKRGTAFEFALARYKPSGELDPSFGSGGTVTTTIVPGSAWEGAGSVLIQPDGKIVAAGTSQNDADWRFVLARYNPDGTLDPSFGAGGKVTTRPSDSAGLAQAALQPDGKIVAAGYTATFPGGELRLGEFLLARYNPDGLLDPSFGSGGIVATPVGSGGGGALAVAIQRDGKIVAAGTTSKGSHARFALARYRANGTLDPGFGSGGIVRTAVGSGVEDEARALALAPRGRIVVAGSDFRKINASAFALARYRRNGKLDPSFGSGGKLTTAFGSGDDEAFDVLLQPNGKIVAAGNDSTPSGPRAGDVFALARYLPSSPRKGKR